VVESRALRVVGGIVCAIALFAPQVYVGPNRNPVGVVSVLHYAFPLVFYVLVNLCIDEGRARERAAQERRRSPP
jgi:hypothetical protein